MSGKGVPSPPDPEERREPLPSQAPRIPHDDPGVAGRVLDKSRYYEVAREFGRVVGDDEDREPFWYAESAGRGRRDRQAGE